MFPQALGIDISKAWFDVVLLPRDDGSSGNRGRLSASAPSVITPAKPLHKRFANVPEGFRQLAAWLTRTGADQVHACLEATGTYGEAIALFLHEQGHTVSVVNPAQTYHFAQSQLSRTKTDKADAELIARFCQLHRPPAWTPPAAELRELQALVRRLDALLDLRQTERNRLAAGPSAETVRESIQAVLTFLEGEIASLRRHIRAHFDSHPELREQRDLLTSIPGIAEISATAILAEVGDVAQFTGARQVAAFAGLAPKLRQSGSSVRGRATLPKRGSSRLRHALYFPAVTALRCNPVIRAMAERLKGNGKAKMAVLGAAMRKLLHLAYGVLKSGKSFDPAHPVASVIDAAVRKSIIHVAAGT